uniref:Tissue factor pathway inhibitor 2 n=1 Tax=Buteo japonicus TaxID=224669 RepID=A0A8C0HNQ4_9AVES
LGTRVDWCYLCWHSLCGLCLTRLDQAVPEAPVFDFQRPAALCPELPNGERPYTQSCQEFTYGGCHGNANNFLTLDDCEKSCWTIKSDNSFLSPLTVVLKVPKLCRMEADGGPCRSHLKRYAFNLSSMRCEEFIYGGCYGNGNNFRDLQSCVDHCLPEKSNGFAGKIIRLHLCDLSFFFFLFFFSPQAGPLLCYSPKDEGLCSSSVPRYYYDSKTKSCKEFKYTGCGGNANNFVTETDCYNVCRKGKSFLYFVSHKQVKQSKYQ